MPYIPIAKARGFTAGFGKAILVMALSFSFGLSVELVPEILNHFPKTISSIFSSGITTGGLVAILSNALIHIKEEPKREEVKKE